MRLSKIASLSSVFGVLLIMLLMASDTKLTAWKGTERKTQNVQTFVLTSFEDAEKWEVEFSQFAVKTRESGQFVMDKEKNTWRTFEGSPWGVQNEEETNCLAVKASFDRKGYNWIEILPVAEVDGEKEHRPLPMVGHVQAVDFWVWGGNFKYRLELHFTDYRGYNHVVDAGWIDFIGWRNIRLPIPQYIPQGEQYVPRLKTLRFSKFVLFAHPAEREDIFYLYLDRMQIQSDVYLQRFDGDDLVEQGFEDGWMPREETLLEGEN